MHQSNVSLTLNCVLSLFLESVINYTQNKSVETHWKFHCKSIIFSFLIPSEYIPGSYQRAEAPQPSCSNRVETDPAPPRSPRRSPRTCRRREPGLGRRAPVSASTKRQRLSHCVAVGLGTLTIAQFLEWCDGRQGGDIYFAFLQRLDGFGLPQEVFIELRLQRSQPAGKQ